MRWVSIVLFCFVFVTATAQQSTIEGTVYSGSYLKPLRRVKVRMGNNSTKTDYTGHFSVPYTEGKSLAFYHPEYSTYTMDFNRVPRNKPFNVYLIPTSNLYSTTLEGDGVEKIRDADYENLIDYTFLSDTLVILSYLNLATPKYTSPDKSFENCAVTFLYRGEVTNRKIVPDKVVRLRKDPFNRLFIELRDSCYELVRDQGEISLKDFSFSEYSSKLLPIQGLSSDGMFYLKSYSILPLRLLKYFDPKTKKSYTLYTARNLEYFAKVDDDLAMLSPEEIKFAKKLASLSDIDYSFYSTFIRSAYIERDTNIPKVQGYMIDSDYYFFDFKNDLFLVFAADGTLRRSNNMIYFNRLSRENFNHILMDSYTNKIYSLYDKSGVKYLRRINLETGSAGKPFKIHHPFAKDVKVFEGYVYYINQSPRSEAQSELVREKLPF